MLILTLTSIFSIFNPKSIFEQIWAGKVKVFVLPENWDADYLENAGSHCNITTLVFWISKFGLKKSKLFVLTEIGAHTHTHTHTERERERERERQTDRQTDREREREREREKPVHWFALRINGLVPIW